MKLFSIAAAGLVAAMPVAANASLVPTAPESWHWNLKGGQSSIIYRLEAVKNHSWGGKLNTTLRVRYADKVYPVRISTVGNECGRVPSSSSESVVSVCVDNRKYIVRPVWEKPGYQTTFRNLDCSRPILLSGNNISFKELCRRSIPTL